MTVGMGIFLIVVGAIIRYALNIEIAGLEEGTLGLILIAAGIVVARARADLGPSATGARAGERRRPTAPRQDY